jgi:hypothetical protein
MIEQLARVQSPAAITILAEQRSIVRYFFVFEMHGLPSELITFIKTC